MQVIETELPGVKIIEPRVFGDSRGYFLETWQEQRYQQAGINEHFLQDNLSRSQQGVLRGLHYQHENTQAKLVYIIEGAVFDVAVDVRKGSPDFGRWVGIDMTADNKRQLYIPAGFAHGFCVTSESAIIAYKCSDVYNQQAEVSIAWNDPDIDIEWPVENPLLSDKDSNGLLLKDVPAGKLPVFA